jgi:hypothetical protein
MLLGISSLIVSEKKDNPRSGHEIEGHAMSAQCFSWVVEHSNERRSNRLVLLALANHASGDENESCAALATLAREAGLSPRQTTRCLRELINSGAVEEGDVHPTGNRIYLVRTGVPFLVEAVASVAPAPNRSSRAREQNQDLNQVLNQNLPPNPVANYVAVGGAEVGAEDLTNGLLDD